MLYGIPYLSSVTDVLTFENKDYFLKNYILGLSSTLLSLRKKGLLAQAPPLDFPIHLHQPGDYVLIKTWRENKLEAAWEGPCLVLLTMETAVWTMEKGGLRRLTLPEGTMDHALTSRRYQSNLKKTIVKLFFLFHLGNGMFIINVTQSTFPLTIESNTYQILPCGDLMSQLQLQGYSFYMCPIWGPTRKLVSVQSIWMWDETLGIKDTLSLL
jgi:hypothetical protein